MIKRLFVIVLFITIGRIANAQCIDPEKIQEGYTFSNYKHSRYVDKDTVAYTDVYAFDADGRVYGPYGNGNYLVKDTLDINLAAANSVKYRVNVENAIKAYAGNRFFSALQFKFTTVAYPERVEVPIDEEHRKIQMLYEKIKDDFKYFYSYTFKADSISSCTFTFETDRFGKVIPRFDFPPRGRYKPIKKHFTYCKLVNIALKAQKKIKAIESISLNYNVDSKRFYWILSQEISEKAPGRYPCYEVMIDAADFSKVKQRKLLCQVIAPIE